LKRTLSLNNFRSKISSQTKTHLPFQNMKIKTIPLMASTTVAMLLLSHASHGASVTGSNTGNVPIPDAGGYVSSTIAISAAPAGAVVTGIDVYFKCTHTYSGDLVVDLNADSTGSLGNRNLWNREGGAADNPTRTTTGITTFNGLSVNRTWYLYAKDFVAGDSGYIDEWTITIYYSSLKPPTPTNPSPGSTSSPGPTQASSTVTLSWSASTGATYYDLGVIDVATGGWAVNTTTTSSSYTANLTPGKVYRWNVAAGNTAGLSAYTTVIYFQTPGTKPPTPTSPSPGSTSSPGPTQASSSVTLSWGASTGATYYDLGVVDVATGAWAVNTTTTSASYTANLTPGKAYRWNVAAGNTAGLSSYTTLLYFQTPPLVVGPPTLTGPGTDSDTGYTVANLTPACTWTAVTGASRYGLYLSKSPYGSANIVYQSTSLTGNSHTIPGGTLLNGTKYRWQMTSFNSAGTESAASSLLYFQTPTVQTPILSVTPLVPPAQPATAGSITFSVNNTGSGTMSYSASVTSGSDWLSITSGGSGGNSGTINAAYTVNNTGAQRPGTIVVSASGASGSPVTLTVAQSPGGAGRLSGVKIGVDPGHGDPPTLTTSGAVGPNGLTERSVNLATALALKKYLEADGATVFLTRSGNQDVSYSSRSSTFINNAVDWGISVHHNGGGANTTMDFIYCGASLSTRGVIASAIIQRLGTSTGIPISQTPASTADTLCSGRSDWLTGLSGVGQANLYMVRVPEAGSIPSVLVEVSFITDPTEAQKLLNADYLDANGWAIYAGIADYYGFSPIPRNGATDTTPPTISAFNASPASTTLGQGFTVSYTVSDSGGSHLKQATLWRANIDGTVSDSSWTQIGTAISLSGDGPSSGSFLIDIPVATGIYWYGIHVTDNANNYVNERVAGVGPIQRTVTSSQQPAMSLTYGGTAIPNGDQLPSAAKGTDFGTVNYGSQTSPRTFTINNTGNGALNLTGSPRVQFGGNNPSDFYMTAAPTSPVGASGGSTSF
jgi:N-acetylmuramoyl-L-alanine amidase/subtilisin-like proprotein convertase family protein